MTRRGHPEVAERGGNRKVHVDGVEGGRVKTMVNLDAGMIVR